MVEMDGSDARVDFVQKNKQRGAVRPAAKTNQQARHAL